MPPKAAAKKSDEDFGDVATLPVANMFKFTVVHKSYFDAENRELIKKTVMEKLAPSAQERVKILNREEIVTYGKSKQIIGDASTANLGEVDQTAKAAADRVWELTVPFRRARRDRLAAAAAGGEEASQVNADPDVVDGFIWMMDYPNTYEEALAFSKYSGSLNAVFEIEEIPVQPELEGNDDEEEGQSPDETTRMGDLTILSQALSGEKDNQEEREEAAKLLEAFKCARADCHVKSTLRNLAFFRVAFQNRAEDYDVTDETGAVVQKKRNAEDVFLKELLANYIDKYGQYYVFYKKFKNMVSAEPLMPDKQARERIEELKREEKAQAGLEQEAQAAMEAEVKDLEEEKEGITDKDELEKTEQKISSVKQTFDEDKQAREERSAARSQELRELMSMRYKASLDDERDYSKFDCQAYEKDFVGHCETQNSIASVLSAMCTQIEATHDFLPQNQNNTHVASKDHLNEESVQKDINEEEGETQAETLDDIFSQFEHDISCDLKLRQREPDAVNQDDVDAAMIETVSERQNNKGVIIHDEVDRTLEGYQTAPIGVLDCSEEHLSKIQAREKEAYSYLNVPGRERYGFPTVPYQSQRQRDATSPSMYPFCTMPIDEAERMLLLRKFQQLVRANKIDNCKAGAGKEWRFRVFERTFENHMSQDIFRQVFANAMLDEPDMVQMQYPRQDSLLVVLFNKFLRSADKASRQPGVYDKPKPVRQHEFSPVEGLDGERKWRAPYKVMPSFENWLAYFADELIPESDVPITYKKADEPVDAKAPKPVDDPNCIPVSWTKWSMEEENLPRQLLDIDDDKIQFVSEKCDFLYPDDNSVMRTTHFSVGGNNFKKSMVIKDNLRFGLRAASEEAEEKAEADLIDEDYGLVSYKTVGDSQFFLNFENGTKYTIEQVQLKRNPQRTIIIQPPPPTAEEIAFKLEQQKKLAEATAKATKAKQPPPTDIIVPKTPQPTEEIEPLSYLDMLFTDADLETVDSRTSVTFKNGLVVQFMGSGHISQYNVQVPSESEELNRLVTKDGIVIRQLTHKNAEMLFPDGSRAFFNKADKEWKVVNAKGKVRACKEGVSRNLESIPTATETDAVTGARMTIREDNVVTVTYKDGSFYCQHEDGTKIFTKGDGSEIRIEKLHYASISVRIGQQHSTHQDDPFCRALDGRVVETYLPDGGMCRTFMDIVNTKNGGDVQTYRHMLYCSDLTVVLSDGLGHASIISSNTRSALNELGEKKNMTNADKDSDYLNELNRKYGQFTPSVYQVHVHKVNGKSHIKMQNSLDQTQYILHQDLTLEKQTEGQKQRKDQKDKKFKDQDKARNKRKLKHMMTQAVDNQSMIDVVAQVQHPGQADLELEDTGQYKEPYNKYFTAPRLFVVAADGSAKELLCAEQLEYMERAKAVMGDLSLHNNNCDIINNQQIDCRYTLTKVANMANNEIEQQKLSSLEFPDNAKQVLQEDKPMREFVLQLPRQDQYKYQQVFQFGEYDNLKQMAFASDYMRHMEWMMAQVRYNTEFGIIHAPASKDSELDMSAIEDEIAQNKRIALKILKFRANPNKPWNAEQMKKSAFAQLSATGKIDQFRQAADAQQPMASFYNEKSKQSRTLKTSTVGPTVETVQDNSVPVSLTQKADADNQARQQVESRDRTERLQRKLQLLADQKAQSDYVLNFFGTQDGDDFIRTNPQKPPSEEVLIRMRQRMERNQKKGVSGDDSVGEDHQQNDQALEGRDDPIVALEPDDLKQGSHFTGQQQKSTIQDRQKSMQQSNQEGAVDPASMESQIDPASMPSLYMQEKLYIYQKEQDKLLKAEEHHIVKTKDFNVYGRLREDKPDVKSLQKSKANSDLNEKFITTECITDRRMKTSSMAPRFYMQAPSVQDVRKQGQHQMILGAINKKQTFGELINQANSMVTGVLHDSMKRSLQVFPAVIKFGAVRTGHFSEIIVSVKNEDSQGHRITIKPMQDKRIIITQHEYGVIAPGMIKKVSIGIRVNEDDPDTNVNIKETIEIVSKHDIFKLPLTARILHKDSWGEENEKAVEESGIPIQNSRVKERLLNRIQSAKQMPGPVVLTKMPKQDDEQDEQMDDYGNEDSARN